MSDQQAIDNFAAALRGELIRPGDDSYDSARAVHNAMHDRRPGLIARCANAADVITAVNFGRDNKMEVAVRGGGHNAVGFGTIDEGLVIDLSAIDYVRVDPTTKTARVGGGATAGALDHATHAFGLAVPTGIISSTGVAGLALGGGHGYLSRKFGLTCDNMLEADVVLADDSFVTANAETNADLFWALRGGGGNFGVVTSFKFQLHDCKNVIAGPMLFDIADGEKLLNFYREWMKTAPEHVYGFFAYMIVPPGPPFPESLHNKNVVGIVWCNPCSQEEADVELNKFRAIATPVLDGVGEVPYPGMNSAFDGLYPAGLHWYWKGDFVREINDESVKLHLEHGPKCPSFHSCMHLYPIDGAPTRVGVSDTAWAYRDVVWSAVYCGVDPDGSTMENRTQWTRDYWQALHPHSAGGSYVNFLDSDDGEDRVKSTYGPNYARLVQIKDKYDPNNFFHRNQNIKPSK